MLRIRQDEGFKFGYNPITTMNEKKDNTMMDFGILRLGKGQAHIDKDEKERVFLLITGEVIFQYEGKKETALRNSCFDENPWVLHVPKGVEVKITGVSSDTEICVTKTTNDTLFESKFYTNKECRSENRGAGTMNEACTRVVRTVFDYSTAEYSNLVIGEDIDYPGKWSSYPPHYHPQPEIYFYKFYPENGYGFSELGEDVVKLRNNDAVKILDNVTHPQVTAPGYAMYYIWVIRHIDGNPYKIPIFIPEHLWVTDKDAKIWPDK